MRSTPVDRVLERGAAERFTGAVARIERGGIVLYERAIGSTRDDAFARPVFVDTRFDLASITKLFVATLALAAVARGEIVLDEPLARWIEEWRDTPHAAITLRMLLAHTSGMHSGAPVSMLLDERVERFALLRELRAAPGAGVIYSDLGMIALGVVLERVRGRSLGAQVATFGRTTLAFCPSARDRASIPATEADAWRGRVQGAVHDEKAHLMLGIAGHAGLFGTAADVAWLTRAYLAAWNGRTQRLLPAALAREATQCAANDPVLRRGLGWALKTTDENSCGKKFGMESFGHTGFTGTCVWADPQRDFQAVLLTNTVYYGRDDSRALRAAFYDAAFETYAS